VHDGESWLLEPVREACIKTVPLRKAVPLASVACPYPDWSAAPSKPRRT